VLVDPINVTPLKYNINIRLIHLIISYPLMKLFPLHTFYVIWHILCFGLEYQFINVNIFAIQNYVL